MKEIEIEKRSKAECLSRDWDSRTVRTPRSRYGHAHDLLGMFDLLATPLNGTGTIAIQITSAGGNFRKRVEKLQNHHNLVFVRSLGWRMLVWGFKDDGSLADEREIA